MSKAHSLLCYSQFFELIINPFLQKQHETQLSKALYECKGADYRADYWNEKATYWRKRANTGEEAIGASIIIIIISLLFYYFFIKSDTSDSIKPDSLALSPTHGHFAGWNE